MEGQKAFLMGLKHGLSCCFWLVRILERVLKLSVETTWSLVHILDGDLLSDGSLQLQGLGLVSTTWCVEF